MGLFDSLKRAVSQNAANIGKQAVNRVGGGVNRAETFTFSSVPASADALSALPEASLDSPFKTAALTLLVLCRYEEDPAGCFAMLDLLKGPEPLNPYQKQFLTERLKGKGYKPRSFFAGAVPENGYTPNTPYTVTVHENPYSFDNENWAVLWVKSSGADNMRQLKLRKKPSTGQWFLNEIQCLSDIRVPASEDPWA